jgi:hypothetical protein
MPPCRASATCSRIKAHRRPGHPGQSRISPGPPGGEKKILQSSIGPPRLRPTFAKSAKSRISFQKRRLFRGAIGMLDAKRPKIEVDFLDWPPIEANFRVFGLEIR